MGVPTLTLTGGSMLARQGTALLTAGGLAEWAAANRDEFVAKAVAFSADHAGLANLRASLRDRVRESSLFDTRLFAQHLTEALSAIWRKHEAASPPDARVQA